MTVLWNGICYSSSKIIVRMRRLLLIMLLMLFCFSSGRCEDAKKLQGGATFNMLRNIWTSTEMVTVSYGCRFNSKRCFGLGTGISRLKDDPPQYPTSDRKDPDILYHIPIFLDYQRYFPFRRNPRHSFILGVEGGVNVFLKEYYDSRIYPHVQLNTGFDVSLIRQLGLKLGFSLYYYMDDFWELGCLEIPIPTPGFFIGFRF